MSRAVLNNVDSQRRRDEKRHRAPDQRLVGVLPLIGLLWTPVLISLIRPIEATLGNQTVELLTLPENEREFVPNQGFNYEGRHARRVGRYG